jgi:carboxylesterase type B
LVWIHGGGLTQDVGRDYDPAKLAADGIVNVTINYLLGALGFWPIRRWPRGPVARPATAG